MGGGGGVTRYDFGVTEEWLVRRIHDRTIPTGTHLEEDMQSSSIVLYIYPKWARNLGCKVTCSSLITVETTHPCVSNFQYRDADTLVGREIDRNHAYDHT